MAWLLLLVIFWKPAYLGIRYLYSKFKKEDGFVFVEQLQEWFSTLLSLVKPGA